MKTLSVPERLCFSTVRIVAETPDGDSVGTGFHFCFGRNLNRFCPGIITNKHVIDGATRLSFNVHVQPEPMQDDKFDLTNEELVLDMSSLDIIYHPDKSVDLCAIVFGPIETQLSRSGKVLVCSPITPDFILSEDDKKELQGMDPIVMVGYPNGIWDSTNNMPIIRSGVTATHPDIDYQGKKEFLIDCACFGGSSGSPVFWYEHGSLISRSNQSISDGWRLRLLGVLYAGPQYTATGEIKMMAVPSSSRPVSVSQHPINLGIVINSDRINELDIEFDSYLLGKT